MKLKRCAGLKETARNLKSSELCVFLRSSNSACCHGRVLSPAAGCGGSGEKGTGGTERKGFGIFLGGNEQRPLDQKG